MGDRLRETQYVDAIGEHRRAPFAKIRPTRIDLREVPDQIRLELAPSLNQVQTLSQSTSDDPSNREIPIELKLQKSLLLHRYCPPQRR